MLSTFSKLSVASAVMLWVVVVPRAHAELVLDLPAAGDYTTPTVVTTSQSYRGATFDVSYTISATGTRDNPFASSTGLIVGVGSDTNDPSRYRTLEGQGGEGLSFTNLSVSNFVANDSGLVVSDVADHLSFSAIVLGSVGNAQDGVDLSFTGYSTDLANVNLSGVLAKHTITLTALVNYVAPAPSLFVMPDNRSNKNRWSIIGVKVDIPETRSAALLAGILGLSYVMLRRREA